MPFTSISAGWIFTLMGLLDDGRPLNQGKSQKIYNYHVPQKNIGHITPIQALKDWHKKQPELFKKNNL